MSDWTLLRRNIVQSFSDKLAWTLLRGLDLLWTQIGLRSDMGWTYQVQVSLM